MTHVHPAPNRELSSSSLINSESGSANSLKTLSQPAQTRKETSPCALFSILDLALLNARACAVQVSLQELDKTSHTAYDHPLSNYLFSESDQKRPSVQVIDFLQNKAMWLPEVKKPEVELEKMQFKVQVKPLDQQNNSQIILTQIGVFDLEKLQNQYLNYVPLGTALDEPFC